MDDLFQAVKLGMAAGRMAREYGTSVKNPFSVHTDEHRAFETGYDNDLFAWMDLRARVLGMEAA